MTVAANTRLIEFSEVTRLTSLRKTAIYERIAAKEFRPIKLGRKTVFSEAEIVGWVNARLAEQSIVAAS